VSRCGLVVLVRAQHGKQRAHLFAKLVELRTCRSTLRSHSRNPCSSACLCRRRRWRNEVCLASHWMRCRCRLRIDRSRCRPLLHQRSARAGDGESFAVQQSLDLENNLHVALAIEPLPAAAFVRFQLRKFRLPKSQHICGQTAQACNIANSKIQFVWNRDGRLHGLHLASGGLRLCHQNPQFPRQRCIKHFIFEARTEFILLCRPCRTSCRVASISCAYRWSRSSTSVQSISCRGPIAQHLFSIFDQNVRTKKFPARILRPRCLDRSTSFHSRGSTGCTRRRA
jgi:hypothetical protein